MSYSARMQKNHLFSVYLAPRGNPRMADVGNQIAQLYMSPFDSLIGFVGESGSGKSVLIRGMFPGLEMTNDDEGVNVRPLPLLQLHNQSFFSAHTYHIDIRFESAFTQMTDIVQAINDATAMGKRVIVEHFDLLYPAIKRNAHLLVGVGEEIIITRPTMFGPDPRDLQKIVSKSVIYRRMAHTAEDLCEFCLLGYGIGSFEHSDVRHGFILSYMDKRAINILDLEHQVNEMIKKDIPISYLDRTHILIGDQRHYCTGPRMHVRTTGEIVNFRLHPEILVDEMTGRNMLVGLVGTPPSYAIGDINQIFV